MLLTANAGASKAFQDLEHVPLPTEAAYDFQYYNTLPLIQYRADNVANRQSGSHEDHSKA